MRIGAIALLMVPVLAALACGDGGTAVVTVTSVTVSPPSINLAPGATTPVAATVSSITGAITDAIVVWSSDADAIAGVAGIGLSATITARIPGNTLIRATSGGKTGIVAVVVALPPQQLDVALDGTGGGTVSTNPGGVSCTRTNGVSSGTCAATFTGGSQVTLTATPANGHLFTGWGGACVGAAACVVTMDQARSVRATFSDPCAPTVYTLTAAIAGTTTPLSCLAGPGPLDIYTYSVTTQTSFTVLASSTAFPLFVSPVAPDIGWFFTAAPSTGQQAVAGAVVAAGTHVLRVGATSERTGAYSLSSTLDLPTGCPNLYVTLGVTFQQQLSTNCLSFTPSGPFALSFFQLYLMSVPAGKQVSVRVTSTAFEPLLEIRDASNVLLASSSSQAGGAIATVDFTPTQSTQVFTLLVASRDLLDIGAYTVVIGP